MTAQDEQHVRSVLSFFYPDLSNSQDVTPEMGDLAARMLQDALTGSHAMDFVPRPPGFKPGLGWLISQAVQIFWRTHGKQHIYETIRKTVALKYRSEFELAKMGM